METLNLIVNWNKNIWWTRNKCMVSKEKRTINMCISMEYQWLEPDSEVSSSFLLDDRDKMERSGNGQRWYCLIWPEHMIVLLCSFKENGKYKNYIKIRVDLNHQPLRRKQHLSALSSFRAYGSWCHSEALITIKIKRDQDLPHIFHSPKIRRRRCRTRSTSKRIISFLFILPYHGINIRKNNKQDIFNKWNVSSC